MDGWMDEGWMENRYKVYWLNREHVHLEKINISIVLFYLAAITTHHKLGSL